MTTKMRPKPRIYPRAKACPGYMACTVCEKQFDGVADAVAHFDDRGTMLIDHIVCVPNLDLKDATCFNNEPGKLGKDYFLGVFIDDAELAARSVRLTIAPSRADPFGDNALNAFAERAGTQKFLLVPFPENEPSAIDACKKQIAVLERLKQKFEREKPDWLA